MWQKIMETTICLVKCQLYCPNDVMSWVHSSRYTMRAIYESQAYSTNIAC